jgi:exopolysaccharide biosynthesis operon protein EpsL
MKIGVGVKSGLYKKDSLKIIASGGIGLSVLLASLPSSADQFDTLNYVVSAGMVYDNNIFRLPSWVDPQTAIGKPTKSDHIQSETIGINLDKKYSNQEILFKANATNNKYKTFSYLDHTDSTYNAAWNWTFDTRLTGTLSKNRTQTLNSFADVHIYSRNLNTLDTSRLDADWWFHGSWHMLAGYKDNNLTNSATTINYQNSKNKTRELGLKYVPSDATSIALIFREIQGIYPDMSPNYFALYDTSYKEKQAELQATCQLTGQSILRGNLINMKHTYPIFSQRDFNGNEGGINYVWSISDITSLNISMNRSYAGWFDFASSYYVTDTGSISPTFQISAKTNMHVSITNSKANYRGPIAPNTIARDDTSKTEELGFDWAPQRSVKISASVQNSRRSTNYSTYEYYDKTANLYLQVSF